MVHHGTLLGGQAVDLWSTNTRPFSNQLTDFLDSNLQYLLAHALIYLQGILHVVMAISGSIGWNNFSAPTFIPGIHLI